jgi:hypothetical protein
MFDMDAACKLHVRKHLEEYEDKDNLCNVMVWRRTPEGYRHWEKISDKLIDRRENYHPHRDVMIELANDKTIEIESMKDDGSWAEYHGMPLFFKFKKYRKKPKMTKKVIEYRIYLDKENKIKTSYGTNPLPLNFKQWLGDWQKVEIEVEENN